MSPPIFRLLEEMIKVGASDLHLSALCPPIFRLHGDLVETKSPPLTGEQIAELTRPLVSNEDFERFLKNKNLDFGFSVENVGRFRGNLLFQNRGISAVFRAIPHKMPTLAGLNAPDIFYSIADYPHGLVLVTGPTGSGKSTTLAAIINHINTNQPVHIISIEDPIEFVHQRRKAVISQREVGQHTLSFADALKAALREDPDVVLVGEMRDLETISLAMTAAETGHLVLGTLHTNNAPKTVDRIIDIFPPESKEQVRTMLSESLRAVISQRLLQRADGKGRVAAYEIMITNRAIANLIREGKIVQVKNTMISSRAEGMRLMDGHISELFRQGVITGEVAYENAEDRSPYLQFAPKKDAETAAARAPTASQVINLGGNTANAIKDSVSRPPPAAPHHHQPSQPPSDSPHTASTAAESDEPMSPLERLRRLKRPA